MKLIPITLGIVRSPGNAQNAERNALALQELRPKILERDDHTCRYCGFKSQKYQEVHFLNGNMDDMRPDNLVTACVFCQQCFDLEKTSQMNSGVLVWLPEIEQYQLSHIARAIYVARISQGSTADAARSALETIMARREDAKARLATDDPLFLAAVLRDFLGPKHYAARNEKLAGIRLFPLDRRNISEGDLKFNQFPQILAYWRSKDGAFGDRPPSQWKTLYAKMKASA
ncbi:MAG: type IV secretion protein DotN [Micavibrio aeruginosavorus]|uniref:Type IV secretion protein DotN n=1 Tax=Micavibrio aeruginosavorus TaxID=349221 RepID=A0A2W5C3X4_9BACT|nr:MAG: type IV secretion protein DotN [Micavibrio aeruginosavorus]